MELKLSKKYQPLFEILHGLHKEVDTVVISGGRNSQKSFAVGTWSCIASKDFGYNVLYTRYTLKSAEDSIIPEFNEKIELLNAESDFNVTKDRITASNGAKVVFKGIRTSSGNQSAALKSLKGFNVFVLEEAEEMPDFDTWDKIKKSIRSNVLQNINILILNPATKVHWIYEEFFEDRGVNEGFNGVKGNVMYIHSTYMDMERELIADNIFADFEEKRIAYEGWVELPKFKQDISPLKKHALYFKHVILGGWLEKTEGVIFDDWMIGDFVETDVIRFGADFGFSTDPTTLTLISLCSKTKRIYCDERIYKTRMSTDDIQREFKREAGNMRIIGDSAEPRLISELQDKGVNIVGAKKGHDSVRLGIALMLGYTIVVTKTSTNLIKELNNYAWHDKKSGVPVDKWNHIIDGIRYALDDALTGKKSIYEFDNV